MAGNATITYAWSADGRLDTVRVGTGTAHRILYEYNVFGRLVRKSVNGVVRRHFVWDRDNLLAELDSTLSARRSEYAQYPGLDAPYAPLTGATAVTTTRYIQRDLQGNVLGLTRPDGTIDNYTRGPEAWGRQVGGWANGSAIGDTLRLGWKGLVYEAYSTKLYYVRARWYDASTRRFLTQDPIGLEGGMNPYTFAENDPVNRSDPTGLAPTCLAWTLTLTEVSTDRWVGEFTCTGGWSLDAITVTAPAGSSFGSTGASRDRLWDNFLGWRAKNSTGCYADFSMCMMMGFVGGGRGGPATRLAADRLVTGLLFKSAHAGRHAAEIGLKAATVESAIRAQVLGKSMGSHYGWVSVEGNWIQYRAYELSPGVLNVGTYFKVHGPLARRNR
ncbi:MAG: RHS repeat-associated core domain-containing protein [Gemmatimonadaceae bacterium]|nr:RHS repeat-associated core domain-containing protein [Gemmatimonadaceae bacterium]